MRRTAQHRQETSSVDFLMDTVVQQKLYGRQSAQAAQEVINSLRDFEREVSPYLEGGSIWQINAKAGEDWVTVPPEVYRLLEESIGFCAQSEGRFDVTIGPLTALWDVTGENPRVPQRQEVDALLPLIDYEDLLLREGNQAMLAQTGQALDLGAVAKGYCAGLIREVLERHQITTGYVSLGGNLVVLEDPPGEEPFLFGVRDPQGTPAQYIGTVHIPNRTMATTGGYERYFVEQGKRYHHVLDPRTGFPAESDLLSVTVISEDGALADFLSTSLFVGGSEVVRPLLDQEEYQLIVVTKEGEVWVSPSLRPAFTPNWESGYRFPDDV